MCGILIVNKKFALNKKEQIFNLVKHRGPDHSINIDEQDYFFSNSILSISTNKDKLDISNYNNDQYALLFNGEIYNYKDLANSFNLKNIQSDTEIILPLFEKFKEKLFDMLDGMFSIIIFDKKRKIFHVSRDKFGIKPLYYYKYNDEFIIASEINIIKTILKLNDIPIRINERNIQKYFFDRRTNFDDTTFFEEIYRFSKGYYTKIDLKNKKTQKKEIIIKNNYNNDQIDQIIDNKIKSRTTIENNKVGLFYSGGFDSSLILDMLIKENKKVELFSSFDENQINNDELKNIEYLKKNKDFEFNILSYQDVDFLRSSEECVKINQFPLPDTSMITHYNLCKLAHKRDIRVILSGCGGDEIFYGYYNHLYAYLSDLISIKFSKYIKLSNYYSNKLEINNIQIFMKSLYYLLPDIYKNLYHNLISLKIFKKNLFYNFYKFNEKSNLEGITNHFIKNHLTQYLDYEDGNSSKFGMESRPVFADFDLHVFLDKINNKDKFFDNGLKSIIRNKFTNLNVSYHKKFHFYSPWEKYLDNKNTIEFIYDNVAKVDIFNNFKVIKILDNFRKGKKEIESVHRIFSIINFYTYCSS